MLGVKGVEQNCLRDQDLIYLNAFHIKLQHKPLQNLSHENRAASEPLNRIKEELSQVAVLAALIGGHSRAAAAADRGIPMVHELHDSCICSIGSRANHLNLGSTRHEAQAGLGKGHGLLLRQRETTVRNYLEEVIAH